VAFEFNKDIIGAQGTKLLPTSMDDKSDRLSAKLKMGVSRREDFD